MLAHVAQLEEHILGKDEVNGSIPFVGSECGWNRLQIKKRTRKETDHGKRKI